jgi:DNA-binding phage protein
MGNNEIYRGRGKSWNGKLRKRGPESRARPYDPSASLRDPRFVSKAIIQALIEGDFEAVIGIYRAHLRVLNRTHAAKALHVSRQYIHRMLKPSNTPSLRTFAAFMKALKNE